MVKLLIITTGLFLLFGLQVGVIERISLFGVSPNIFVAVIACVIIKEKTGSHILFLAAGAGLLFDFFSSSPFGLFSFSFLAMAWVIQSVAKNIFKTDDLLGQISLIIIGCFTWSLASILLLELFSWLKLADQVGFWQTLWRVGLIEAGLNIAISLVVLYLVTKIHGLLIKL